MAACQQQELLADSLRFILPMPSSDHRWGVVSMMRRAASELSAIGCSRTPVRGGTHVMKRRNGLKFSGGDSNHSASRHSRTSGWSRKFASTMGRSTRPRPTAMGRQFHVAACESGHWRTQCRGGTWSSSALPLNGRFGGARTVDSRSVQFPVSATAVTQQPVLEGLQSVLTSRPRSRRRTAGSREREAGRLPWQWTFASDLLSSDLKRPVSPGTEAVVVPCPSWSIRS